MLTGARAINIIFMLAPQFVDVLNKLNKKYHLASTHVSIVTRTKLAKL